MKVEISITQASKGCKQTRPDPEPPKYCCCSCHKQHDKYCDVFLRRIEPCYNKCFLHSEYNPILFVFIAPANLKEIMKAEESLYD